MPMNRVQSGDAVAMPVARLNREGMAAVLPRQCGGHPARHTVADRERILAECAAGAGSRAGRHGGVVAADPAARLAPERFAPDRHRDDPAGARGSRIDVAETAVVVRDGHGATATAARGSGGGGDRDRSRCRGEKD